MTTGTMKLAVLGAAVALAAPIGGRADDTGSAGGAGMSEELQEGLQELHAANQAEVQLGTLAQQSAASPQVKAFGRQMVADHGRNDQQLTTLAKSLGVNLQGDAFREKQKEGQDMAKDVQGKTGREFDRAYTDLMVKDHEEDAREVGELAKQARDAGQSQLAAFLATTEQKMKGHLAHVQGLRETAREAARAGGTGSADETSGTGVGAGDTGYDAPAPAGQSGGERRAGDHAQ
jgi:putative membrane protein